MRCPAQLFMAPAIHLARSRANAVSADARKIPAIQRREWRDFSGWKFGFDEIARGTTAFPGDDRQFCQHRRVRAGKLPGE
jgi:hypothetical protein